MSHDDDACIDLTSEESPNAIDSPVQPIVLSPSPLAPIVPSHASPPSVSAAASLDASMAPADVEESPPVRAVHVKKRRRIVEEDEEEEEAQDEDGDADSLADTPAPSFAPRCIEAEPACAPEIEALQRAMQRERKQRTGVIATLVKRYNADAMDMQETLLASIAVAGGRESSEVAQRRDINDTFLVNLAKKYAKPVKKRSPRKKQQEEGGDTETKKTPRKSRKKATASSDEPPLLLPASTISAPSTPASSSTASLDPPPAALAAASLAFAPAASSSVPSSSIADSSAPSSAAASPAKPRRKRAKRSAKAHDEGEEGEEEKRYGPSDIEFLLLQEKLGWDQRTLERKKKAALHTI